ncbi:hypothetical protein [Cryobacterium sp. BB307]|uniref:hypothetical protein n=1 Tax=Cryobacterium sp. BB307 TaxID=2716317 RepID=UPI001446084F|nr:hypothetical protein [Cryobacterium sp. BB307]
MDLLHKSLEEADPARGEQDDEARELILRMSVEAERAIFQKAPIRWWKNPKVIVPLSIAGVIALTGAAALAMPIRLWVGGQEVELDGEIPIIYTTDTGVFVHCTYGIHFGDPAERTAVDERAAQFMKNHDWTGIGQRIYDEAIANPFVPGPNDDFQTDSQQIRDMFSFQQAMHLIWTEIPDDIDGAVREAGGASDCKGQLR